MSENKFEQFSSSIYDNDDFELEEFQDNSNKNIKEEQKAELVVDNHEDIEKIVQASPIPNSNSLPFTEDSGLLLEDEINKTSFKKEKNINLKKLMILSGAGVVVLLLVIISIYAFSNTSNNDNVAINKSKFASLNETTDEKVATEKESNSNSTEKISEKNESSTGISEYDLVLNSADTNNNAQEGNHEINVNYNSDDDVINVTEAILSPSTQKIKISNKGEFDGLESNKNEGTSIVKVKENSSVIPTISKSNFIPDVKIDVLNTETNYTTNDLIKIEYNVLLNSKTLSYSISKKIYKDKDFIIDLNLNNITSDIVSIEENLLKEEVTVPINIMTSGSHTVWFKINGYPVQSYTFNIK